MVFAATSVTNYKSSNYISMIGLMGLFSVKRNKVEEPPKILFSTPQLQLRGENINIAPHPPPPHPAVSRGACKADRAWAPVEGVSAAGPCRLPLLLPSAVA